ncbi:multicopy suppressor of BFA (Brefeldin A) [Collariella sp. IMI 366227]|nr:multicopy suppressor of BFA (Brefeldin A) [Collariella sp. IMI 366227]
MATATNAPAAAAAPAADAPVVSSKPSKPDDELYKKELARLDKELKAARDAFDATRAKFSLAVPDRNKPNPARDHRQQLISQLQEIRQKQGAGKQGRVAKQDQAKRLEEELRNRISEQKTARDKLRFKSAQAVDEEIARLENSLTKRIPLAEERKAVDEISNLRRLRKTIAQLDDGQKAIDDLKTRIKDAKAAMDDPEAKALSEQYNKIQAELDAMRAEENEAHKNKSALRKERDDAHAKQELAYQAVKQHKDQYWAQRKAFLAWDREQYEKRRERERAERDRIVKERKMERAQQMLAEASYPAYTEEIRRANSLLHFLDPTHVVEKTPLMADKGLAATAQRKVDDSAFKGMRAVRKEDRDEDYFAPAKKSKRGKKTHAASEAPAAKFSCPPSVMEDCAFVGLEPPMSAADVPEVKDKNIEKAKKEIERLEAEEAREASGTSTPPKEDKEVADVTEKVEKTSLEGETKEAAKEVEATA